MGVLSNKIEWDQLKVGDHIYSWRQAYLYSHHGIYVGERKVIHFTNGAGQEIGGETVIDRFKFSASPPYSLDNPCPICGYESNLNGVISSCLDCFLWDGELYRYEYGVSLAFFIAQVRGGTCTLAPSDPPGVALHRASYLLKKGFGVYHLSKNNCEDFAIYCKTGLLALTSIGVGTSGQAASLFAVTSVIICSRLPYLALSFSGLAAVGGIGMYCVGRVTSDIGNRRDVTRVPVEKLVCEGYTKTVKKD